MFGIARRCCSSLLATSSRTKTNILAKTVKPFFGGGSIPWIDNIVNTESYQQIRCRSNRSRRGLYDGKDIRTGNSLSFSMKATKRKFKPNVFVKRVYSETLDEMIRFHLTAATLRSIDKAGGLDNYLLKSKHVTEGEGLVAKKRILQRMKNNKNWEKKKAKWKEQEEKEKQKQGGEILEEK